MIGSNVLSVLTAHRQLETSVHHDDEEFVLDVLRRR